MKIIKMLTEGEKCACELLKKFEITQPTLSRHMRILSECTLVLTRKEGKWSYYSLNSKTLTAYREFIGELVCTNSSKEGACCHK